MKKDENIRQGKDIRQNQNIRQNKDIKQNKDRKQRKIYHASNYTVKLLSVVMIMVIFLNSITSANFVYAAEQNINNVVKTNQTTAAKQDIKSGQDVQAKQNIKLEQTAQTKQNIKLGQAAQSKNELIEMAMNTADSAEGLLESFQTAISYEEYLKKHSDAKYCSETIQIPGGSFFTASENFEKAEQFMDTQMSAVITQEEGSVLWEVNVLEAGFYQILIDYYPIEGKNGTIERELYINGELPFDGAQYLEFTRVWENSDSIKQDARGNEIKPRQREVSGFLSAYAADSTGYYTEPFEFYFEQGKNTIELSSVKEPMAVCQITLTRKEKILSYAEYKKNWEAAEAKRENALEVIKVQGEDAVKKSHSTLYPISDRSSPATEPYHASKLRLNAIGGVNWQKNGQWITWEFEVPEDGFYEIALKYRQNIKSGVTVVRSLFLDGKIPFKEAKEIKFYYENDWQIKPLGNEEESFVFYFTKGSHTMKLEVSLGSEMSDILRETDEIVGDLNAAYRQMLMVIGSSPDGLRDYQLELKTPEALNELKVQYEKIKLLSERVEVYTKGSKGMDSAAFDKLINQLKVMTSNPSKIAKQWAAFKDNIASLASWSLSMKEQPLEIDYFLVQEPGTKLPKATAGFFQKIWHAIKAFFASFFEDYDSIGDVYGEEAIEVWVLASGTEVTSATGSGRDQAQVIKELVDNYFIPQTKIPVNVKLVNSSVLLSATLSNRGPDVALNVAGSEPVNYALRHAVTDLTQFEDFDEVAGYFHEQSLIPFTLEGGVYALPQTMSFHVLFYRADILKELGIEIPRTWDEFYDALAVIQKSNMNIGITPDYTTYAMFLYQHGGAYYTEDGKQSGLSSEQAILAFKQWSSNYANYKLPVTFNFANRFRTGEMPLAIADYTNYNYLSVFAPEIRGLWGFTTVPGYQREDGTIDRSVSAWQTASVILDTSNHKKEAWEFLKWWMKEETQTNYGNEIENILGVGGRVATANIEALKKLPWSNKDYRQLTAQLQWIKSIPEVPGGYFTSRHITNAFYTVYNKNEDPRETLEDFVKTINNEIENKRLEFGLDVKE